MKCNLQTAIALNATAAGGQSEGSSLNSPAVNLANSPKVKDMARARLVKTSPDVDAMSTNETQQTDAAAFVGKRLVVQDTKYGHLVSEHNSSASASLAEQARPYSRTLRGPDWNNVQQLRDRSIKKAKKNPDTE